MKSEAVRVLIVDDQALTAELTASYLESQENIQPTCAFSLEQALSQISAEGTFDVVLLDLEMPDMNGIGSVQQMVETNNPGHVALFSGYARTEGLLRALDVGVRGFIPKSLPLKSLANAIRFISLGETYLPPSLSNDIRSSSRRPKTGSTLSDRELDVLAGVVKGKTNKEIANGLGLSEITVKMHVKSICMKLDASNRTQIAMIATQQGLI